MPKAKPTHVVTHRIEMQGMERELAATLVGAYALRGVATATAAAVGVTTASYLGYKALKARYGWQEDIVDPIRDLVRDEVAPALLGKEFETDPATGKSYRNPFAGIPVVGPLFGAGINIGIATNPFD